jgi:RNA polymerase sigma-70 factor (ECF subfamily)
VANLLGLPRLLLDIMDAVDGVWEVEAVARSEYRSLVRAVALSCGSVPAAEDAVQEAFARAWERTARGEVIRHVAGWVVTVALNHTRRMGRRDRRGQALLRSSGPLAVDGMDVDELADLHNAVTGLPVRQREVVVMHYLLGYPVATIASLQGVSEGAVKNALFRARRSLAAALGDREGAPE